MIPDSVLERLDVDERTENWRRGLEHSDSQNVFLLIEKGSVIGFASGGPERTSDPVYTGELYTLYLLESTQKRGYGRALFLTVVRALLEQGYTSMLLWVLSTNPARGFYETMGGTVLRTKPIEIGGEALEETAYGYADLRELSSRYSSASA